MTGVPKNEVIARCACGNVELEATGAPIVSVACYCDDCQEGSRRIEALPNAPAFREPDGGTAYLLYRKDRVKILRGSELLAGQKIKAASLTNRVVATCCNSAMVVSFDEGKGWAPHWIPVYRAWVREDAPPLQMQIFTKFRRASGAPRPDVPAYPTFPIKMVAKLLAAKLAMWLKR